MKHVLLLTLLLLMAGFTTESLATEPVDDIGVHWRHRGKMDAEGARGWYRSDDVTCRPEMRGRCGKRRGDFYGARHPVSGATEARELIQNYFTGQEYTVSEITEKRWGFKAEILDKDGKVIDRVMLDKRSGRIRSLY